MCLAWLPVNLRVPSPSAGTGRPQGAGGGTADPGVALLSGLCLLPGAGPGEPPGPPGVSARSLGAAPPSRLVGGCAWHTAVCWGLAGTCVVWSWAEGGQWRRAWRRLAKKSGRPLRDLALELPREGRGEVLPGDGLPRCRVGHEAAQRTWALGTGRLAAGEGGLAFICLAVGGPHGCGQNCGDQVSLTSCPGRTGTGETRSQEARASWWERGREGSRVLRVRDLRASSRAGAGVHQRTPGCPAGYPGCGVSTSSWLWSVGLVLWGGFEL